MLKRNALVMSVLAGCSAERGVEPGDDAGPVGPPPDCIADSPESGGLVINELMAVNALTIRDGDGNAFDWIELHNTTARDISLCGWRLTRQLDGSEQYAIGHENVVPAGRQRLLFLTDDAPPAADRVPIHLRAEGELGLIAPDGSFSDRIVYGTQTVDFSAARQPDGGPLWQITWRVTPGEANSDEPAVASAEDPAAPPEMVPAAGDLTERILGYDVMLEIGLEIDAAGIAALAARPFEWVPGSIVFDGRAYGPVGIRLKGQNSFQPIDKKPSFRINIDEYVDRAKFFNLDDLTLNNMDNDFSMMHERLAYLVARQLGPASRANHALVEVNGAFYGLYANVETVKRHMLSRWFADSGGSLYEATDVDFRADLIGGYEHESGPDDRSVLFALAAVLEDPDADAAIAGASAYVDMESLWQYWAMCAVVGQFDAFPYSNPGDDYFIYIEPTSGKLVFLPWGMDETFYSADYPVVAVTSVLAERCLASPGCHRQLVDHIWAALELTEDLGLSGERARIAAEIAAAVALDERKPYSDAQVSEFQSQLRFFIDGRRRKLVAQLPPPSTP